jgi:hypothetical protein
MRLHLCQSGEAAAFCLERISVPLFNLTRLQVNKPISSNDGLYIPLCDFMAVETPLALHLFEKTGAALVREKWVHSSFLNELKN